MNVSRQEYPSLLAQLQPSQAVNVLNERVSLINKINLDIADWLQERRKVEEAYAAGLRKLARRPQQDGASSLGIFQMPWQRIVSGTESLAQSHETLAGKIETDVETPLRQYQSKNREMAGMTIIQGNLASISKEFESAQKKADKLKEKGSRGDKYANAANSIDGASREWETQAPFVFEQLQALDESRCNHLRDVLTQFQTHEIDQVERNRVGAESCLNALLNVETADEIKTFSARVSAGRGSIARRRSSATASAARPISSSGPPPTPPPPRQLTQSYSQNSVPASASEDRLTPLQSKKSSFGGIKRGLGTVIGRRKSQAPLPPGVPEKEKKKGTRSSFAPFRRGDSSQSFQGLERSGRDLTPVASRDEQRPSQLREQGFEPNTLGQSNSRDVATVSVDEGAVANGEVDPIVNHQNVDIAERSANSTGKNNGADGAIGETYHPPQGPPPSQNHSGPASPPPVLQELAASIATPDVVSPSSEYSSSTSQMDSAFAAAQETSEDSAARNLLIRDQPIPEDETEAQKAMSSMANQLRMQAPMARVQGSTRGRRDVRNTVFMPNTPDLANSSGGMSNAAAMGTGLAGLTAGAVAGVGAMDLASPIKQPSTPGTIPEERATSDTASLHSSHSLANVAQHPMMEAPGLNASIIETVSTWLTEGSVTKSFVVGEVALAMNGLPEDDTETIRLSNFQILEKVAANPTFVHVAVSDQAKEKETEAGQYRVDVNAIRKSTPTVALKYQIHLDADFVATYSPVLITPAWQCELGRVSVIVMYSLNSTFIGASSGEVVLKNVVITVSLDTADGTKATGAMISPQQGASFKRKAGAVVWRMSELKVGGREEGRLLVRFTTTSPGDMVPNKGTVEAKWEYEQVGAAATRQLGVTRLVEAEAEAEADPFADESEAKSGRSWAEVSTRRKLISGRYSAL